MAKGLLLCKPENVPTVGELSEFTIEDATSKAGKPYKRFRRNTAEYGGTPYKVISASQTGHSDQHGNVWVNVEAEEQAGATPPSAPATQERNAQIAWAGAIARATELVIARGMTGPDQAIPAIRELAVQEFYPLIHGGPLAASSTDAQGTPEATAETPPAASQGAQEGNEQAPAQGQTSTDDDDIPF